MRIALWQPTPGPVMAPPSGALAAIARQAAEAGAELLLTPELSLVGPIAAARLGALAEPSDGSLARAAGWIAREAGIALLVGYAEACSGGVFSSALLIDMRGHGIANYRRTHLRADESDHLARGQWMTLVPVNGRRVGIALSYDLLFPEMARGLVLAGAELLLVAGSDRDEIGATVAPLLPARAVENGVPVAYAAWAGARPDGSASRIVDAAGREVTAAGAEATLLLADLGSADSNGIGAALAADRRPRLYQRLIMVDDAPVG